MKTQDIAVYLGTVAFIAAIGILILVSIAATPDPTRYKVGECFASKANNIYKVTEKGKYGLKAITQRYSGFEENFFTAKDIQESNRIDCFDYFDVKDPNKQ